MHVPGFVLVFVLLFFFFWFFFSFIFDFFRNHGRGGQECWKSVRRQARGQRRRLKAEKIGFSFPKVVVCKGIGPNFVAKIEAKAEGESFVSQVRQRAGTATEGARVVFSRLRFEASDF